MRFRLTVDARWLGSRTVDVPDSLAATSRIDAVVAKVEAEFTRIYPTGQFVVSSTRRSPFEAMVEARETGTAVEVDFFRLKAVQIKPAITLRKHDAYSFTVLVDGIRVGEIDKDTERHRVCWTHGMTTGNFKTKEEAAKDLVSQRVVR